MVSDIEDAEELLEETCNLPQRTFREAVARYVLELISWNIGRTLIPEKTLTEEGFCDAVALAFACAIECDRPARFARYPAERFAKVLIERYMIGYQVIDDLGFPDEELVKFTYSMEDIPEDPKAELCTFIREIDVTTFGRFALPVQQQTYNQPESP
ncbi:MAG: hypothetical protein AAB445_02630 [Patescibacteria group bacterium]